MCPTIFGLTSKSPSTAFWTRCSLIWKKNGRRLKTPTLAVWDAQQGTIANTANDWNFVLIELPDWSCQWPVAANKRVQAHWESTHWLGRKRHYFRERHRNSDQLPATGCRVSLTMQKSFLFFRLGPYLNYVCELWRTSKNKNRSFGVNFHLQNYFSFLKNV